MTGGAGDKTKRLGFNWPLADQESRGIHSQEGHSVEPIGEVQERQTPTHVDGHKNDKLDERQLTWLEAKRSAQDRVKWRALVDDLFSIRKY